MVYLETLDYPILNVIPLPEFTYEDIPMRFIFPIEEATLNNANLTEAIQMIGGNTVQTKVFWDNNNPGINTSNKIKVSSLRAPLFLLPMSQMSRRATVCLFNSSGKYLLGSTLRLEKMSIKL